MIKYQILKIISDYDLPICDDCISFSQNFNRQQSNRRCSDLVNEKLINTAKAECNKCKKFKKIKSINDKGKLFLTQLENKENILDHLEIEEEIKLDIILDFKWIPIIENELQYIFPNNISKKRTSKYHRPAIYRWILTNSKGEKTKNIYVGEAINLSNRMYNYVNPGKSQKTNLRLSTKFKELIEKGYSIQIDELKFKPFQIGLHLIDEESLKDKFIRRFLEHLLASYYKLENYNLFNN